MRSPDPSPSPKPAGLTAKQLPWGGARKPPAPAPPPAPPSAPAPKPPVLTAKQLPWGRTRKPAAPPTVAPPPPVAPAQPDAPPAAKRPLLTAKKVPWGGAKKKAPPAAPAPAPSPTPTAPTWALPKDASLISADAPANVPLDEDRDAQRRQAGADREPTAEQLVAMLKKRPARRVRERPSPLEPYKARPLSFAVTRWDVWKMRAHARRWSLSFAGAGLSVALVAIYVMRLVSLNGELERQWHGVETMLRQRYAMVPAYVKCIESFGHDERFTLARAEKAQAAWRAARSEKEIAAAAARMEHALALLAKVLTRYDQDGVTKEPEQAASLNAFARLEEQKNQSRALLVENIRRYNRAVGNYNAKVLGVPGSWVAWMAGLHARASLYSVGQP